MPSKGVLDPGRGPSYIRVTTPANLELALEGLVRKVLKEQPKQEDIYSFAADYFEHLVEIRDKAENPNLGVLEICPGRSDAEANDLIKLATSFAKPAFLGGVFGAELCNVVDADQEGVSSNETLQERDEVYGEPPLEVEGNVDEIQNDEANHAENLTPQESEVEVTASEQFQESKSEESPDLEIPTKHDNVEESEAPRDSNPDVNNSEQADRNLETESEEISDVNKNTAEIEEGEPEPEAVTQASISEVAESPENREPVDVAQDAVTDVTEDQQSEDVVKDAATDVTEDQKSEDVAQDAATDVTEGQKSEDVAQNAVADVTEDQQSEDVTHNAVTDITEGLKSEQVTQDTVSDVLENPEDRQSVDGTEEAARDVAEDKKSEDVAEGTDLSENAEHSKAEVVPPGPGDTRAETLNGANDGKPETEQALHDDIPSEQLLQDEITEKAVKDELSQNGETPEQTQEMKTEPSEVAELQTEDITTTETPAETSIVTEPLTEGIPSHVDDLPSGDNESTEIPTETSAVTELPAEINPPPQTPPEESVTREQSTEDSPSTEITQTTSAEAEPMVENTPTEIFTETPAETEATTEDTPSELQEVAKLPSDDSKPIAASEATGPITEDTPPELSEAVQLPSEDREPIENSTEVSAATEPITEDSAPEALEAEQLLTEDNNLTEKPRETSGGSEDTHPEHPEAIQSPTEDRQSTEIPTETSAVTEPANETSPPPETQPTLLTEPSPNGFIKTSDPSQDLITAETEPTEITKERDIIREFLEREQEFSTMGNSTRSLELVDVHLEDPPSDLSLTSEATTGLIGGTMIENSVFEEEPNQELAGGLIGGVSSLESKEEGLIGGVVIPDPEEVVSEEPITASLIGGISHAPTVDLEESSSENPDLLEKHDEHESPISPVAETQEVVEQASAVVDDVLQQAAGAVNEESSPEVAAVEEDEPKKAGEPDEAFLLKEDSSSNHSRSSKESESLDEENPFISAEVKTLVQEEPPAVVETDSQEDEADVIIPLNAEIGTIQESDEGKWDAQLTLARAAIVIQKNFRKYLQRKNNNESFTRSEEVGKESTSTDSSLSSSATKIRQSSRTIESSRSDTTNSFNEPKLIKAKAKSMSTVPDSEVWNALEQELEESGNTQQNSHRQKLRREDAVQITTTASEDSATESPKKQRLLGTGELHDLIVPEEN